MPIKKNYFYSGSEQTYTAPKNGYYNVELWGARGGSTLGVNGYGGYTKGLIYLNKDETIKLFIGSKGAANGGTTSNILINGGYNGGANASNQSTCSDRYWGSGGGATDMRLTTSLNSRLMVAGGGGGCYGANNNCTFSGASACSGGGAGGSLIGQAGQTANGYVPGAGATQINGGLAASQNGVTSIPGTFGIGGGQTTAGNAATGGGGGYYGGAGSGHIDAAGGGSSFMSGYAGSNAITSSSSTAATNDTLHYSGKYFISGSMYQGINSGNGRATISYAYPYKPVKINTNLNNVRYIKDCTTGNEIYTSNAYWIEVQAIKNGINVAKGKTVTGSNAIDTFHSSTYSVVTNGIVSDSRYEIACSTEVPTSKCVTVDLGQSYDLDEVAVWHVWGYTSLNNVTSVSSNNSTWTTLISNTIPETSTGKRVNAWE